MKVRLEGADDALRAIDRLPDIALQAEREEVLEIAKRAARRAQSAAASHHPHALTPRHPGEYHWSEFVRSFVAGESGSDPFVALGDGLPRSVLGWEYGSDRVPQFGPPSGGRFFQPALVGIEHDIEQAVDARLARELRRL